MGTLATSATPACPLSVEPLNTLATYQILVNPKLQAEQEIKHGKISNKYIEEMLQNCIVINK